MRCAPSPIVPAGTGDAGVEAANVGPALRIFRRTVLLETGEAAVLIRPCNQAWKPACAGLLCETYFASSRRLEPYQ